MRDGDQTVLENVAGGRTSLAVAATVVRAAEATCFVPDGADALRLSPAADAGPLPRVMPLDRLLSEEFMLRRAPWAGGNVLYIAPPAKPYAVYVRWSTDWQFRGWYVNLQQPTKFRPDRWVTEDHFLDILVEPDGSWTYKDDDELAEAVVIGRVSSSQAQEIRDAGAGAAELVERRDWPFAPSLAQWRPDPAWGSPMIPPQWRPTS